MTIKHNEPGSYYDDAGAFYVDQEGKRLGELVYKKLTDRIIIEHTEVSDELRGKGAGKQLVAAAVDYARKNNLKVVPLCSFAKGLISKVKEFQDVL
jgi:predicted GNAT family acetyltransferase